MAGIGRPHALPEIGHAYAKRPQTIPTLVFAAAAVGVLRAAAELLRRRPWGRRSRKGLGEWKNSRTWPGFRWRRARRAAAVVRGRFRWAVFLRTKFTAQDTFFFGCALDIFWVCAIILDVCSSFVSRLSRAKKQFFGHRLVFGHHLLDMLLET